MSEKVSPNPRNRNVTAFLVMCLATYLGQINIRLVDSSFKEIQAGLATGPEEISWILTSALIAEVVMLPLSGWLCRLFSTKWLFTGCLLGFTLASAGCANAWNIESMIAFRAVQGFSGGALMPMVFAAAYTVFPKRQHTTIFTILAFVLVTPMAIAPLLGGWITESLSWRWMFWFSVPIAIPLMLASVAFIHLDKAETSLARHIDFLGIVLAAVALVCLIVVVEEGQRHDWFSSRLIFSLAMGSAVSVCLFIWRELICKHPVVDLKVFGNRDFSVGCFYICIYGVIFFVPAFLLPLYLAEVRNIDTLQIGTIIAVLGISMGLGSPFAGALLRILPLRWVAFIGFGGMAFGNWLQGHLTADVGFSELILPQVIRGLSSQCCWLSCVTLALSSINPEKVKNASALYNLFMRIGAAVALALGSTQLENNTLRQYSEIANTVTFDRPSVSGSMPTISKLFEGRFGESPTADQAGLALLVDLVTQQAMIMAFNDVTKNTALLSVMALLLLPLFRGRYIRYRGDSKSAVTGKNQNRT